MLKIDCPFQHFLKQFLQQNPWEGALFWRMELDSDDLDLSHENSCFPLTLQLVRWECERL